MTKTKLAAFEVKHKCMTEMQEKQFHLLQKVNELQDEIAILKKQRQEPEVGENSAAKSVNKRLQPKCVLVDWAGTNENVAEGRIISSEPDDLVNDTRLGPTDVKVLVDSATVPDAFLWRPASNMFTMVEAVGQMIAWPASKCVDLEPVTEAVDITPLGQRATSINKCKLLDLSSDDVVVAEGRWQTEEPKALVNGLPLGPKAVKVFIDQVHQPETFIWRPTIETTYLEDCLLSFVAWPACKVVFENRGEVEQGINFRLTTLFQLIKLWEGAEVIKENQKCKLMDIGGRKLVVAEGHVHSINLDQMVHFVRLGSDAARVWVDIVNVDDAAVWKPSDEIETLKDAHGSSIAWPMDKLVIF
ncbi:unnamed protein product [Microthlaspi erraticum]|uniref:Transposase Tnp1/En/Spm-like domain-containing protein n=1 Tax=Microthlaspi erraticum TaxID=1685480 RepID=A0A6D2KWE8_9BRAS|nr:unnamed protein product [Microthlaspi erraticum]